MQANNYALERLNAYKENGWSGWYKDWYFRSLRELSYMINVIEAEGLAWRAQDKNFKITYTDYAGQERTYFPDFIINDSRLIEIKPARLHQTPKVLAKKCGRKVLSGSQYEL